jgi:DNA-binding PadR family transcriptional regulator
MTSAEDTVDILFQLYQHPMTVDEIQKTLDDDNVRMAVAAQRLQKNGLAYPRGVTGDRIRYRITDRGRWLVELWRGT